MLPVVWQDKARLRVREIVDYISDHNELAALDLEAALASAVDRLANFPQVGRPGRLEGTREWVLTPNYLIVYLVTEAHLEILNILHARRQYP